MRDDELYEIKSADILEPRPAALSNGLVARDRGALGGAGGMSSVLMAATALLLDWLLGEPRRRHPLVGFGRLALYCERRLYGGAGVAPGARRARGVCATLLLLAPWTAATATLAEIPYLGTVVGVAVLYLALGHRSLHDHARPVAAALCRR